ncbi:cysteine--tRNA ligase [Actinocorallia sp. API 0066]|uniref:cysteine--tRNA ligase n=1 Tax=Actinocorallia sp. API 0066 TaxID=2896846 RepID=UPI001E623534|nr:cysteine--tRNA ligase [Actinocorallia sp. API 0066]MCD0451611.1 cysteine--tRNA ligase [Actinocorallia sp. API 0066]
MTIRLYDTRQRQIRDFHPLVPGRASIYLCGATVQGAPHIGHIRSGLNFDILRRWLSHRGYDVTFVRNVTDIDDKILRKSAEQGRPWWAIGYENERAFNAAYEAVGCLPPTYEPRATGHIPEMVEMVRVLVDRGHAYAADGNVYFDIRSLPGYLALSRQELDDLLHVPAEGAGGTGKRDVRDFALWKAAAPGEPSWDTPWGPGRPGWHLECSAMAHKYLGAAFDIHGGGIDLVFPHHENEIAQARGYGDDFAAYWVHNAWVTLSGEKMSKSLGNSVLVRDLLARWRPIVLRYYLATPHYRSTIEYGDGALREADAAFTRVESFIERAVDLVGPPPAAPVPAAFAAAMDDDLGVPQAVSVVHTAVRQGNVALRAGDKAATSERLGEVRAMLGVLGLDPTEPRWSGARNTGGLLDVVGALADVVLEQRQEARARGDFAAADALRTRIQESGLEIEDTASGPRWKLRGMP